MVENRSNSVVELEQVTFTWPGNQTPTLDIKQLHITKGEHLFIKGPSGCGKSTLLGLLTGINTTSSGQLRVLGQDLNQMKGSQRDKFRADHIGYIFQQFNLLPYLNVIENVILPCQFSAQRKSQVDTSLVEDATRLLEKLHLPAHLMDKPVVELSIGQQQRVAAARALIGKPALIIADEPTSSLDYDNRTAFIELLLEQVNQAQSTLLFVSHDPTLESLFDRTLNLNQINQAGAQQ
ncbi:methionine ABC transporter ATP-binding protein [Vibrio coralliilyticus]|jgi:putative ABC transport system ATP-binding protein|uniref:Methionine ABC transporter ATP-binding protein n=1 Tax=Vibrio coralliilyticus TaxID=190893 RepID=A0A1V0IAI4_9VIBR|nr:ABC transporter ATP-binding protein [Vibrio coralliilyticus]AIU65931.1 methionine ABC transporter ATP-binding protein [Vibrio coralliilyticus]ARC93229.1 methionine ABC transporter ATP-binding protein [Vibrio coralliilyticus]AXN31702.1 ABC transporter ATP-binding protein [Vibrio coralliilyticus]KJY71792.1 methionine ABC transporter ATP-binding protein [Vibrio coralliilyticus]KPH28080.1 methionine ABC transporter ATP-binding protein [Vibrio coralliilyticus]